MRLRLTIDDLPNLQADTMHWRTRHSYRKRWHNRVRAAVIDEAGIPRNGWPLRRAHIVYTRHSSHHRAPDADNLAYSFKAVQDGLVKCGILDDDTPEHITTEHRWQQCKRGEGFITVEVEEQ